MLISITSYKGGVGKSSFAVHLAAILSRRGSVLLIDADLNRSALSWSRRGSLPFKVADVLTAGTMSGTYDYKILDTAAHPSREDLETIVQQSDRLVIVCEPEIMSLDVLPVMLRDLAAIGSKAHRVLLSRVPPVSEAIEARGIIEALGAPIFKGHVRNYSAVRRAAVLGTTCDKLGSFPHAADVWQDYQAIARELK